ncbi:transposase [Capnocytophaga bilenii]
MTKERKVIVRYSDCFKRSVIEEIEKNGLSIEECRRKYAIGGATTIQKWLRMYGKNHLLNKIVRVETIDEIQEIKALKKEIKALKEAYAEVTIEKKVYETYLQVYGEETGRSEEIKKKLEQELSKYFPRKNK